MATKINPIDIQRSLKGLSYPAEKDEILNVAQENDADEDIIRVLGMIADREYGDPADIMSELSE